MTRAFTMYTRRLIVEVHEIQGNLEDHTDSEANLRIFFIDFDKNALDDAFIDLGGNYKKQAKTLREQPIIILDSSIEDLTSSRIEHPEGMPRAVFSLYKEAHEAYRDHFIESLPRL